MNLVYMAKPIYGGWVTFTSHLALKCGADLYKIGKRTEPKKGIMDMVSNIVICG